MDYNENIFSLITKYSGYSTKWSSKYYQEINSFNKFYENWLYYNYTTKVNGKNASIGDCITWCVFYKLTWKLGDFIYIGSNQNTTKNRMTFPICVSKVTVSQIFEHFCSTFP